MPASAANVPSAVPTLPNLFDAVDDTDDGDDYPVVVTRALGPAAARPPARPSPVRLAPAPAPEPSPAPQAAPPRQTLLAAAPASDADGWLVMFDDEDDDVTVETALSAKHDYEEAITSADVIEEEVVAVENLESGIRRARTSLPPPLPRAAAPAQPVAVVPVAPPPRSAAPPSVPPARSRLWAEDRDL